MYLLPAAKSWQVSREKRPVDCSSQGHGAVGESAVRRRGPGEQPRPQEARVAPGSLLDCAGLRAGPQGAVRAPGLHGAHGPSHSLSKGGFVTVVDVYVLTLGSRGPLQPLGYEISALSPYWQPLPQEAWPLTRCSVPVPHTGARPRGRHRGAASGGRGSCSWGPPRAPHQHSRYCAWPWPQVLVWLLLRPAWPEEAPGAATALYRTLCHLQARRKSGCGQTVPS